MTMLSTQPQHPHVVYSVIGKMRHDFLMRGTSSNPTPISTNKTGSIMLLKQRSQQRVHIDTLAVAALTLKTSCESGPSAKIKFQSNFNNLDRLSAFSAPGISR